MITRIFSALWKGADGLRKVLHLILMLMFFGILLSAAGQSGTSIPASGALLIKPAGLLVEELAGDPFDRALAELMDEAEPQTLVQDIIDGLEHAADDDRIRAVILDLSAAPGGGLSKLVRVADAMTSFRESGKTIIARADIYTQGSYFLAAHADEIHMHPEGGVSINGFGAYQNYYKNALDKALVDWNVFRVGTYKTGPEPYTRSDMSEADKESIGHIIDQFWDTYVSGIESARELEPGTVMRLIENAVAVTNAANGDNGKIALDSGYVDYLSTREDLRERILEVAGSQDDDENKPSLVGLSGYLENVRLLNGDGAAEENVAVIVASGTIVPGSQAPGNIGGDSTSALLRKARFDDSVKAVVLRVDSGGGSRFASEIIRHEVQALRDAGKPVVASLSSVAASGGYWISMAADQIFAAPDTITGSIGIYGMVPTFQRTLDYVGITTDGIANTPLAGALRQDRALSDDIKQIIQTQLNYGYDEFLTGVADGRKMSKEEVHEIAQGRIWSGDDGIANNLVDELGELDDAVAAAADLADLEEGSYGTKSIKRELEPGEQLLLDMLSGANDWGIDLSWTYRARPGVEMLVNLVEEGMAPLMQLNDPFGIYAYCFCDIQ